MKLEQLFALYPSVREPTKTMESYFHALRDLRLAWVRKGLYRLVREPGRRYLPSVGEIRAAVALEAEARWHQLKRENIPTPALPTGGCSNTDRWLALCRTQISHEEPARAPEIKDIGERDSGPAPVKKIDLRLPEAFPTDQGEMGF